MGKLYGRQENMQAASERFNDGVPQVLIGAAVIGAELVASHIISIPETVETVALGGGGGLALTGLYNVVRGLADRREGRRWR